VSKEFLINNFDTYENGNEIIKGSILNYIKTDWSSQFINFTDLQSFGFILYLAYPIITVLLGILLWIVLIGILKISESSN
jgi:hypothetical protein